MKANELMLGDYTSVTPSGMPIKVAAIHHKKVAYHAVVNKLEWVRESLLEPISLTPNILEKNGFVNKDNEWVHYCDFPFIDFILNKDSDGFYIDCIYTPNGYIQYVHELQHAFKLFKVDREIII